MDRMSTTTVFFSTLDLCLSKHLSLPIIMAGDWNTTYSCDKLDTNLDVMNMASLPNPKNALLMGDLCEKFGLVDPFRIFFPSKREFTYIPRDRKQKNRSRLDFFLISEKVSIYAQKCIIRPTLENFLFDHKAIELSFIKEKNRKGRHIISDFILSHELLDILATVSAVECYLHHAAPTNTVPVTDKLKKVGEIRLLIREICSLTSQDPARDEVRRKRDILLNRAKIWTEELNLEQTQEIPLSIDYDLFLETFVNCVRNDLISFQSYLSKVQHLELTKLGTELKKLKSENKLEEAMQVEFRLTEMVDKKSKMEFDKLKNFEILHMEKITPFFYQINESYQARRAVI